MGTSERRRQMMLLLCRRRHETMRNLASEFGVSERTIRRDVEALSCTEPIYTQTGRYGGGVYVMEGYYIDRMYMSSEEIGVLKKVEMLSSAKSPWRLTAAELAIFKTMIAKYEKPTVPERK